MMRKAADTVSSARRPDRRAVGLSTFRITLIGFAAALVGGFLIELGEFSGLSSGQVLRDIAASFDLPVLAGSATVLSVMLLAMTAAIAAFTARLVPSGRSVLVVLAVLSFVLALDDQFLWHERGLPRATGLPEEAFLAVYACWGGLVVFMALKEHGLAPLTGLIPAIFFVALSVVADLELLGDSSYATEDLLKIAGFAAWAAFWISFCAERIRTSDLRL